MSQLLDCSHVDFPCQKGMNASSDDKTATEVTGMSHFIQRGSFEDALNHQL